MRSSFNDLLMALSILNIIYIFTGIVDYTFVKVIFFVSVITIIIDIGIGKVESQLIISHPGP